MSNTFSELLQLKMSSPSTVHIMREPYTHGQMAIERVLGQVKSNKLGPTIVFFAGIHGNEPASVVAVKRLFKSLEHRESDLKGNVIALAGNINGLSKGVRYQKADLNRMWTRDRIEELSENRFEPSNMDEREQLELYQVLRGIYEQSSRPVYFIDLHTTSSPTIPFVVMNDSLLNRGFARHFPVPVIVGIEEYLEGPILSWINDLGYLALGFEAGQHKDPKSVDRHFHFMRLVMQLTGNVSYGPDEIRKSRKVLQESARETCCFYEIFLRYRIKEDEAFEMAPGFVNFQRVYEGQQLGTSNGQPILADRDARVFMPLYQGLGEDGFFAIRGVPKFVMLLSKWLRNLKVDHWMTILPGISWSGPSHTAMIVDRKIARFLTREIFHLMGYRVQKRGKGHFVMFNREARSRYAEYLGAPWLRRG
jgi:predicted deacylase